MIKKFDLTLGYYNEHTKADYADKYTSTGVFKLVRIKKNGMIIEDMIIV